MKYRTLALFASLALLGLAGCGSSPPNRFYTLESRATAEPAAGKVAYSVTVVSVSVPDLVDRPQMVMRVDSNRVAIAEQSRWGEPLKSAIARAVAGNLGRLLDGARVGFYPQSASADADYRVAIDVQNFESAPGTAATIEVLWTVKSAKGKAEKSGRSLVRETVAGTDPEALVAAHERALIAISRDIAAAVRGLAAAS
jgi:uncharacterized lipoprotein YmbA